MCIAAARRAVWTARELAIWMLQNQIEEGVSDCSGTERENGARRRREEEEWIGPRLLDSFVVAFAEVASVGHDGERELLSILILIPSSSSLNGREFSLSRHFRPSRWEAGPVDELISPYSYSLLCV
jgi:hypothetical protein